jgi:hypothetical protein
VHLRAGRDGWSMPLQFRSPPPAVQRAVFAALGAIARSLGYRATYPQLSRTVNAPRIPA